MIYPSAYTLVSSIDALVAAEIPVALGVVLVVAGLGVFEVGTEGTEGTEGSVEGALLAEEEGGGVEVVGGVLLFVFGIFTVTFKERSIATPVREGASQNPKY